MGTYDLRDRVALVTGGASGFGRATALKLAEAGAVVVVADVDEEGGRTVAESVGGHFVRTDVSDLDANRAMVAFAVDQAGGLDLMFLNAGVGTGCGLGDDFDLDLYRRAMGINLDGVAFGIVAGLPALRARGGGAIVATSSLAGLTAVPYDPIYAANKHAVVGMVRSLGALAQIENIRINAVCPGFAETALIAPIRDALVDSGTPLMRAEKVADTVIHLFSSDASGEAWFVQPGRPAANFAFRGIPGPRPEPEEQPTL